MTCMCGGRVSVTCMSVICMCGGRVTMTCMYNGGRVYDMHVLVGVSL
jgi:hypothetical protein